MGTTVVLDMLERNYKLWCSQNDVELDDSPLAEGEAIGSGAVEGDDMDVDMAVDEDEWNGFSDPEIEDDELPDFFKQMRDEQIARNQKGLNRKKKGRVHETVREKVSLSVKYISILRRLLTVIANYRCEKF